MSKIDLDQFRKKLRQDLEEGEKTFEAEHAEEIQTLLGFAAEKLGRVTPQVTEKEAYDELVAVVAEARDQNWSQAQLQTRIGALGGTAVRIAKRVAPLAKLLV